ncbi:hypothetical protein Megpolyxen_01033 [Candidatus Megaera polyxenophila]|nr:hypothetical protein Megpolyxen_01033 [Candidatus Megaera polyxenophila]
MLLVEEDDSEEEDELLSYLVEPYLSPRYIVRSSSSAGTWECP